MPAKKNLEMQIGDDLISGMKPLDDSMWDSSSNSNSLKGKDTERQEAESEEFEDANVSDEEADEKDMYENQYNIHYCQSINAGKLKNSFN